MTYADKGLGGAFEQGCIPELTQIPFEEKDNYEYVIYFDTESITHYPIYSSEADRQTE